MNQPYEGRHRRKSSEDAQSRITTPINTSVNLLEANVERERPPAASGRGPRENGKAFEHRSGRLNVLLTTTTRTGDSGGGGGSRTEAHRGALTAAKACAKAHTGWDNVRRYHVE